MDVHVFSICLIAERQAVNYKQVVFLGFFLHGGNGSPYWVLWSRSNRPPPKKKEQKILQLKPQQVIFTLFACLNRITSYVMTGEISADALKQNLQICF